MQRLTVCTLSLGCVVLIALVSGMVSLSAARADDDFTKTPFRRGDAQQDGRIDISDPISVLLYLFLGGGGVECRDAADSNDDGTVDISDALYTLGHLFLGGPQPPAPGYDCGVDPTDDALDCVDYLPCSAIQGPSEFSTPLDGAPGGGVFGADDVFLDAAGAPGENAPPAPQEKDDASTPERLIEEADLFRVVGDHIFVLNRYRGLQVIDLSDLDDPVLVGRAPIYGYPLEMYVRDNTAYVIVSDYYTFWRDETAVSPMTHASYGSQLRIIDISDVTDPVVVGGIDLQGDCSDSRIIGDVLYLVANRYPWYYGYPTDDTEDKTQVFSVRVADPDRVEILDTEDFPRNGWEHHIMVTQNAVYLAASGYSREREGYETSIRYVDISDPAGAIVVRGEAAVEGRVEDRWSMDEYEGVLRVASGQSWGNGDVYLTTFSVESPDAISRLGQYVLRVDERLTAARFDGPRGYLVSYRNIDPLFTFDLTNPAMPRLLGELEMSGWLDFIVPLGDRLVALGHEDQVNPETGARTTSLAVSLIDVSLQAKPKLLSRVSLDGAWGWVPGDRDDFAKVFKTLPDQGLILFPFRAWSRDDYRYIGGVQLIDFDAESLALRGLIQDCGWVERGIPHDESTVLTLSNEVFQVIDITDRGNPTVRGRLELARNVQEFALLPGGLTVQLAGDWYLGDTQLVVTSADDPDSTDPISRTQVGAPYGRMFVNGSFVYLASVEEVSEVTAEGEVPTVQRRTKIQVVDLTEPESPKLRGSVVLPEEVWPSYHSWYWGWGDEAIQVAGSTLVFHRYYYPWIWWDCWDCMGPVGLPEGGGHSLYVVDLSNPDEPVLAPKLTIDKVDWAWGLKAFGRTVYLSFYRSVLEDDVWRAKYYLTRVDVSDPSRPIALPDVNIPGMFLAADDGSPVVYTFESWWERDTSVWRNVLHALILQDDTAYLQSSVDLGGYHRGVIVDDETAYAVVSRNEPVIVEDGKTQWAYRSQLVTVDLSDPTAIGIAGSLELPLDWSYLQTVDSGRVFLGTGFGILMYRVDDPEAPSFEQFFRTQGWTQTIVVDGDRAWVPSGYYGVQVLELSAVP